MRRIARSAKPLTTLFVLAFTVLLLTPVLAAPVPSQPVASATETREQLVARADKALDAQVVSDALKKLGITEKQVAGRLAGLSDAELRVVASGGEALQVAGAGKDPTLSTTTWLLVIVILLLLTR